MARSGDEAIEILKRFGAPALLVSDLSLPRRDGFVVMEALRRMSNGQAGIIALSGFRELREYAASRTDLRIDAVIAPTVPRDVLRQTIAKALAPKPKKHEPPAEEKGTAARPLPDLMRDAVEAAGRLAMTSGAAIYLKLPNEQKLRAQVGWTSESVSGSPFVSPRIFDWVMETGDPTMLPDLAGQPFAQEPLPAFHDVVRGLVAVPVITKTNAVAGVLCAFDVKPLQIGPAEVDALRALGRWVGSFVQEIEN
jgi:CheY-like chemotaxis protein